jgi:uncharacterized protein (DUF1800 family)
MSDPHKQSVDESPWTRYRPSPEAPWNLRRVVHLHRRAGFAANWGELQRDLADGPEASIARLLAGKSRTQSVAEGFERTASLLADSAREPERLKAWWVYRMLYSPDPLGERLTLMWHNHFATSALKVRDLSAMRRQNELFRALARAPFGQLLPAAVRDPTMLVWLDAPANRKEHPNENLARELMELFSLGIGHYTEADVKEAARALTGWTLVSGKFHEDATLHDAGDKTILGRAGRWRGDDLVRLVLDHPATAERLALRLCEQFMGEGAVDAAASKALASGLRTHDLDIGWAVETVLRSQTFFAEANLGNRIPGPVEYIIGSVRALEQMDPPLSTYLLAYWMGQLGQDLFYPPNVGGWPGGRTWITAQTMIGRAKYAAALVGGTLSRRPTSWDATALARCHARGSDLAAAVAFYAELLLGAPLDQAWREEILEALGREAPSEPEMVRRAVAWILASPPAQLA